MPGITLVIGIVLILLGLVGKFGTGTESWTPLIPSAFGLVLAVLGLIAMKGGSARKHAMHVAAMFGLLGFLGGLRGVSQLPALFSASTEGDGPAASAVWLQVGMAVICAVFVGLCVKSFIDARRNRTETGSS